VTLNPKQMLDSLEILPKKSLGQNFLHDPNALDKIVTTARITASSTVLEVGPGTGALTTRLAQTGAHVIAVEIDGRLVPLLRQQLKDYPRVQILEADILNVDVAALVGDQPYIVVANLPYYITSAILRHLLESRRSSIRLVLTVQQEVAERLVARPDDMSLLTVSVQFYGRPRIVTRLNPAVFWPRPDVDSAVVEIEVYPQPVVEVPGEVAFFRVVRAGFSQKRKQIKNSLGAGLSLSHAEAAALLVEAGIDPVRRAETLTLEEWAAITRVVAARLGW
jgi:16S rRNA (adenine1518-N6/adenine1519-N6)-dimethyltransferase